MANDNKLERKRKLPWSDSTSAWTEWSQKLTEWAHLFSHVSDHEHVVVIKNTKIFTFWESATRGSSIKAFEKEAGHKLVQGRTDKTMGYGSRQVSASWFPKDEVLELSTLIMGKDRNTYSKEREGGLERNFGITTIHTITQIIFV